MMYVLRDVPPEIWDRVRARAEAEQRSLRSVVLALLKYYAAAGLPPGSEPPHSSSGS